MSKFSTTRVHKRSAGTSSMPPFTTAALPSSAVPVGSGSRAPLSVQSAGPSDATEAFAAEAAVAAESTSRGTPEELPMLLA
eukprot:6689301-Pyramimonas_sp.AAC.1